MSTTQQPPAQPLTPEQQKQASVDLMDRMKVDVFFSKLAEYEIVPKTAEEARQLLALGLNIQKLSQHPTVKQAERARKAPNVLDLATSHLNQKMAEFGIAPPQSNADEFAIEKLSEIYSREPAFQEAVLAVYGE